MAGKITRNRRFKQWARQRAQDFIEELLDEEQAEGREVCEIVVEVVDAMVKYEKAYFRQGKSRV